MPFVRLVGSGRLFVLNPTNRSGQLRGTTGVVLADGWPRGELPTAPGMGARHSQRASSGPNGRPHSDFVGADPRFVILSGTLRRSLSAAALARQCACSPCLPPLTARSPDRCRSRATAGGHSSGSFVSRHPGGPAAGKRDLGFLPQAVRRLRPSLKRRCSCDPSSVAEMPSMNMML
jgi:hypothetical protein